MALNWNKVIALTAVAVAVVYYRPAEIWVETFVSSLPLPLKEAFFFRLTCVLFRWLYLSIRWFFSRDEGELGRNLPSVLTTYDFLLVLWSEPLHTIVKVVLTTTLPTPSEGFITMAIVVISTILTWRVCWKKPRWLRQHPSVDQQPAEGFLNMMMLLTYMLVDLLRLFFAPKWSSSVVWLLFFCVVLSNIKNLRWSRPPPVNHQQ